MLCYIISICIILLPFRNLMLWGIPLWDVHLVFPISCQFSPVTKSIVILFLSLSNSLHFHHILAIFLISIFYFPRYLVFPTLLTSHRVKYERHFRFWYSRTFFADFSVLASYLTCYTKQKSNLLYHMWYHVVLVYISPHWLSLELITCFISSFL